MAGQWIPERWQVQETHEPRNNIQFTDIGKASKVHPDSKERQHRADAYVRYNDQISCDHDMSILVKRSNKRFRDEMSERNVLSSDLNICEEGRKCCRRVVILS